MKICKMRKKISNVGTLKSVVPVYYFYILNSDLSIGLIQLFGFLDNLDLIFLKLVGN